MDNDQKSFVIDVAKTRTYQNQDEDYQKAYSEWRSRSDNPYAYSFVHDTREHSYVAGEGFRKHEAVAAEHMALCKCLGFLGLVMLIMFLFDLLNFLLLRFLCPNSTGNILYFSEKMSADNNISVKFACLYAGITLLKYIVAIVLFKTVTKIPICVALPHTHNNSLIAFNSIMIMLMVMVIGRVGSYLISVFFSFVKLDAVYIYMMCSDSAAVTAISAILNCIVIPILCEIFFRGFVMQTLRQFDDSFAVIVSAIIGGISFYDLSYFGYAICCSIVLGIFTIRTGSVYTAVLMHICASSVNYFLAAVSIINETWSVIFEVASCMVIIAVALILHSKLSELKGWSYNLTADRSGMPFSKKMKVVFSTNTLAIWLVCAVVITIFGLRVL